MGLRTGLPRPICARSVGLDRALAGPRLKYEEDGPTMGEEAAELGPGTGLGMGIERRGAPEGVRGLNKDD